MVLGALAGAAIGAACRTSEPIAPPERALTDIAERYVRVALKLAQHQPDLVDAYLGPAEWRPGPRVPVAGLLAETIQLSAAIDALGRDRTPEALRTRLRYLAGQVKGLRTAARRLAGESMRFADEARDALGIEWSARPSAAAEDARRDLDARLPGTGSLHERYTAFRRRHAVARDAVLPVFEAAIAMCRERVRERVTLPDEERVDADVLDGGGFEARAIYSGAFRTRVAIDPSGTADLARIVWLAAHEAYPGHHLQHVLAERECVRGKGWIERTLHPGFGPHMLMAEGAAEAGAALLLEGDDFLSLCASLAADAKTTLVAIPDLIAVQRRITSLDDAVAIVADAYLDGGMGTAAAVDQLREEVLVPDASQLLGAIERQRTRILAYPVGRRLVIDQMAAMAAVERWPALQAIATQLVLKPSGD